MWTKKCNPDALGSELAWILYPPGPKTSEKRRYIKEMAEDMSYAWKWARFKYGTQFPPKRPPPRFD